MVEGSDVVFVSVKPVVVPTVLQEVKNCASNKLFVSVAMGITIQQMENVCKISSNRISRLYLNIFPNQILPKTARVIRVMPNTPAIVNQGCSVYVRGTNATNSDAETVQSLLQSIGTSEEIKEDMMDAVTALSGSGPAYVFVMIEALADGAVKMGLYFLMQLIKQHLLKITPRFWSNGLKCVSSTQKMYDFRTTSRSCLSFSITNSSRSWTASPWFRCASW